MDSAFLNLPAELRLHIYEYALQFEGVLQRPRRASAWRNSTGLPINTALLSSCRQVLQEAKGPFYELNEFRVSYHHMSFDEQHIRTLEVRQFLPRVEEPKTCQLCSQSGFGLIAYAQRLPKVRSVKVAFEDIFSFTDFAPDLLQRLSELEDVTLGSDEVGRIKVRGLSFHLELQLPALHQAWSLLCNGDEDSQEYRQPGQGTMLRSLEYLQFEANTYDRTASCLAPFFIPSDSDDTPTLRFLGLADEKRRRAEFTIALAGVLNDILEDDGGSGSIDWVELDGMYGGRWRFDEVASPQTAPAQVTAP